MCYGRKGAWKHSVNCRYLLIQLVLSNQNQHLWAALYEEDLMSFMRFLTYLYKYTGLYKKDRQPPHGEVKWFTRLPHKSVRFPIIFHLSFHCGNCAPRIQAWLWGFRLQSRSSTLGSSAVLPDTWVCPSLVNSCDRHLASSAAYITWRKLLIQTSVVFT